MELTDVSQFVRNAKHFRHVHISQKRLERRDLSFVGDCLRSRKIVLTNSIGAVIRRHDNDDCETFLKSVEPLRVACRCLTSIA